ncbi:phosphoglucosamine mutase [Conexibacter sp. JD483]|uniref:phosphoglucosamine mutase n=1 Tax=unclassified Conexibacter TaxID=2627773 RepID=UPI002727A614|nr:MULTISPECIES: phosphoglucosamine mutase [unclassified Conexibacter]MDO8187504.1 phosphoglucosamine mutase [Conexibacter sp. CPCC 205706]MDO8199253.1 phosphoglucosamine mutase [Conexibacter sp. CPCC 205762]MDR9369542.1 phosphoglucosamine mutase [Conexibacter sp. JD483]
MARRLFGTDGVRGVAGEFLSAELTLGLARAATARIAASAADHRPRVLVIRDTRESGEMLEAAVAAGVAAAGGLALLGGVLPTPAAPLLIRRYGFDLGVVLSASHNPYADNGVKFFGSDGDKLSDAVEEEIEALLDGPPVQPLAIGGVSQLHGTLDDYLRELQTRFGALDLSGRRILLDCANGATYKAAPEIFRRLGAHVDVLADAPDGRNINANCGSTHLDGLAAAMRAGDHDAGFGFDGDGDRVLAVDGDGTVVDGDELVALAALHLRAQGRLRGDGVAVTVMTNYGFHAAMAEAGIEVAITSVGDRYVLEALRERDWALGGEQSGHIVELGFAPSGDGIASALLTLEALGGKSLGERGGMEKLPQRLVNVRLPDRSSLERAAADPRMQAAIERESAGLEGRGRVLVRASGTEPLLRVMVEAPEDDEADAVCARLVEQAEAAASQPAG